MGDGMNDDQTAPVRVGSATDYAAVAGGSGHSATDWTSVRAGYQSTCALKVAGELWCWGANNLGQLSDGTTTEHWSPAQVR